MSASRLLSLLGASIVHNRTTLLPVAAPEPQLRRLCRFSVPSLRFRRFTSSSAALDTTTSETKCTSSISDDSTNRHPWPEWVAFVDGLQAKGYLLPNSSPAAASGSDGDGGGGGGGGGGGKGDIDVYKNMNLLKDASLRFARDRFDIFKSLSRGNIERVVEIGCPNLLRKVVNSSKRLRAFVQLDEGDVCSSCNLRGSCDRAYVILKDYEAAARTVDIMRILLFYALDPLVISCGEKPPGRALVEASARNLLSELVLLSETSPDPAIPKSTEQITRQNGQSSKNIDARVPKDIEMKRGDWMCPKCNFMNFARNLQCRECNEDGPRGVSSTVNELRKGDWVCSGCNFINFSRNQQCLKCKAERPKRASLNVEMKKGDWNCPECGLMNFASNKRCLQCSVQRPKRELEAGQWECPECDYLNFSKNMFCRKCNCERPKGSIATEYEEQLWTRPS
ncbi:hypothetical protein NMG60_11024142 [Bertholletia excelsa]